ncbi:ATP-binding cassette domain-containing protein [Phycicoccus sp. CSK15P-2]|uniref:ABC transporter ATP-binding protein n=1 Tax=Phycicoccus sp. CSK15P-2 TaxID=2807627 RepID=UPI00195110BC|nr:ATP-binding cassette domain-containing protein [Phycicoccus sp. CSK15P-2]MBM6405524.1 ATP-binding cassette domain-containing protein [Phycicoccus sp. CSK15P-2]
MIHIENLTKRYGGLTAVDDISFTVRPGTVTGFLGPNGAGKSTALRMLTGLTPPTSGTATIGGRRYADLPNPAASVGVMLDATAQHPGRTGREVLRLGAMTIGVPDTRVEELLDRVGITADEARRRVRNYSLGMRQRLGLAGALLGTPRVLVLDEPANGLDPQGIHWMRELLREFASEGGTVLLSSHLLGEVAQTADELVIIGRGSIVAQGPTEELVRAGGTVVRAEDAGTLGAALAAADIVTRESGAGLVAEAMPEEVGRVARDAGVALSELRTTGAEGLEATFLELTADTARDKAVA